MRFHGKYTRTLTFENVWKARIAGLLPVIEAWENAQAFRESIAAKTSAAQEVGRHVKPKKCVLFEAKKCVLCCYSVWT